MNARNVIDRVIMLVGVALVVAPVSLVDDSSLLAFVLVGILLIAIGVWRLGSHLLPERRIYTALREEVGRFLDHVRNINASALEGETPAMEDARVAMHASVDKMFRLAGQGDDTDVSPRR